MTRVDALCFTPARYAPALCEIDLDDIESFLSVDASDPTAYLLKEDALATLLERARALDKSLIDDRGEQHVTVRGRKFQTTRFIQELGSVTGHAALLLRYRHGGKLASGVRKFLSLLRDGKTPRPYSFFLGTTSVIWDHLARGEKKVTSEEFHLRELRKIYVGRSRPAQEVRRRILVAARAPLNAVIMLNGESGTGKEIVANAIHRFSKRSGTCRAVNCGSIPEDMAVDALFGHEDGTFTGVRGRTAGYFEQAQGGTLFLDEIGELPRETQAMLLRAVQERVIYRIGGVVPVQIDVKIIVATHRNLHAMTAGDRFRSDLMHRLGGYWIFTPTLREHPEDVDVHVRRIWCEQYGRAPLPSAITRILRSCDWPGNVRQLGNVLLALSLDAGDGPVTRELLMNVLAQQRYGGQRQWGRLAPRAPDVSSNALAVRVERYREARPRYVLLEHTLRTIVERIVKQLAPLTVVRSSTLSLARFAERVQRPESEGIEDPLEAWRDLCGVRAILYTQEQKQALYAELWKYLELADTGQSATSDADLTAAGFRPLEYFARIREGSVADLGRLLDVDVPSEMVGLWGRVRLRTVLEEVNLAVRDEAVPLGTPLPEWWGGKLVALEGVLGNVQRVLGRIYASVKTWAGSYGAYRTEEDARRELALLENALACVPEDASMAARAGKLAMILGDWDRAIAVLEPHVDAKSAPVLRDLGVALCKKHEAGTVPHQRGLRLMEEACRLAPHDPDAFASFAGALKRAGHIERARQYYEQAVAIDGADPYALGGCLETSLMLDQDSDVIGVLRPAMERAIVRCRDRVAASVDLPWAYFDLGKYLGLLGEERESLEAYAKGIRHSNAAFMLETTLRSVEALVGFSSVPATFEIARRMLAVGWCARFPSEEARKRLAAASSVRVDVQRPVLMIVRVGDELDPSSAAMLRRILTEGCREFRGTVLSVGEKWSRGMLHESVRTIDYGEPSTPGSYPTLQAWVDVMASRVSPAAVFVLILGDDQWADADRRLAVMLGAHVGVVRVEEDPDEEPATSDDSAEIAVVSDGKALAALLTRKK